MLHIPQHSINLHSIMHNSITIQSVITQYNLTLWNSLLPWLVWLHDMHGTLHSETYPANVDVKRLWLPKTPVQWDCSPESMVVERLVCILQWRSEYYRLIHKEKFNIHASSSTSCWISSAWWMWQLSRTRTLQGLGYGLVSGIYHR
jgi:hypothetical protein